jgi:UDPglucose 6-dehydrogenase
MTGPIADPDAHVTESTPCYGSVWRDKTLGTSTFSDTAANIGVIGAGYVGLVTSACLAELGHTVTCVEIDRDRLARLERGEMPIHEPGLDRLVERNRQAGRLAFSRDHSAALKDVEFAFVSVNTPPSADGQADVSFVFAAVRSILDHAGADVTVVTKSTVPVGTGDAIADLAASAGRRDVNVVSNPEFLREGSAVDDFMAPDRIVVGAEHEDTAEAVTRLFANLDAPVVMTDRRSAELAKYAANAFLATRISFINEVATLCEAVGADVGEVARIVGSDRRIGPSFLQAGLGWGGSCFPNDVRALAATAADVGCRSSILPAVFDVNARQRERAVQQLLAMVDTIPDTTVAVLGLAFKPNTDDIREAPALEIIGQLLEAGIRVRAHDPIAMDNARRVLPNIEWCMDAYDAAKGSDAVLLATEWREYLDLDWRLMRDLMPGRVVLDGRNVLDGGALASLGFTYLSIGRLPLRPQPTPIAMTRSPLQPALQTAIGTGDD